MHYDSNFELLCDISLDQLYPIYVTIIIIIIIIIIMNIINEELIALIKHEG